jgi:hypothetical protein
MHEELKALKKEFDALNRRLKILFDKNPINEAISNFPSSDDKISTGILEVGKVYPNSYIYDAYRHLGYPSIITLKVLRKQGIISQSYLMRVNSFTTRVCRVLK